MIIDYQTNGSHAGKFAIYDRDTGEMIESPENRYFYADDEAGILRRYLRDDKGMKFTWDRRTKERIYGLNHDIPSDEIEVAWEEIRRSFVIRPRMVGVLVK